MRLDLRELIVNPGVRLPFHVELETDSLDFPSVKEYLGPPTADGLIFNEAGILHMQGTITADMLCICDRCGRNLNLGPCGCGKEIDPRFAVLEQLLDKA